MWHSLGTSALQAMDRVCLPALRAPGVTCPHRQSGRGQLTVAWGHLSTQAEWQRTATLVWDLWSVSSLQQAFCLPGPSSLSGLKNYSILAIFLWEGFYCDDICNSILKPCHLPVDFSGSVCMCCIEQRVQLLSSTVSITRRRLCRQ